jgi:signal transduction histidine kinase/chemotaxis methyl-accepting protein methylase/chemotaxis response regulator CheB
MCPIVGIGASAGGLDAIRRVLEALPADTGMAFAFVQHLDPHHPSLLVSLLSSKTLMPVLEASQDEPVLPNHVYVLPPSQVLTVSSGRWKLEARGAAGTPSLPIDALFRALAETQGGEAIGVVLSGTGTDGTRGLQEIEAAGGLTIAQDPATCTQGALPQSAIDSGVVALVLTPQEIGRALAGLGRRASGAAGRAEQRETRRGLGEISDPTVGLEEVLTQLRLATRVDLTGYRRPTLSRRIARRMAMHHVESLAAYAAMLTTHVDEAGALLEDCLVGVTSFFRDTEVFEALSAQAIPRLLGGADGPSAIRAWVAGCSSGEEAYSVAICLSEQAALLGRSVSIKVFASDLSERSLTRARAGVYPETIAGVVSRERLERFFTRARGGYRVTDSLRELCIFSRHDLIRDPPFSRIDLLTCRNLLIYLEPQVQERVLRSVQYALRPRGVLLLGPGESPSPSVSGLEAMNDKLHLFVRRDTPSPRLGASTDAEGDARQRPQPAGAPTPALASTVASALDSTREHPVSASSVQALLKQREAALGQLQSSNDDALSANEELRSVNEELQSVNQELQTAKEEIESTNAELALLNQELLSRNVELSVSNLEIREALSGANALIDSVRQPLLVLDAELKIERANAAFHESFQSSPSETRGLHIAQVCGGQWNVPALLSALATVLVDRRPLDRLELEIASTLGPRTLWIGAKDVLLARGGDRHLLVSFDDRTEAQRIERQREALVALAEDARRRAEASDVLKDQFVATVSHELRGPLNVISSWTNILRGAGPSPEPEMLAKALGAMARAVSAQGRLLTDLLDYSRVATGGLVLERVPVDLMSLAQTALDSVRTSAQAKGVELGLVGARGVSIVLGDADRLQQVLWNLFFNAVKFTPRGGTVNVTVTRDGAQASVTVRDTGCGIPPEFLSRVFDRFRQAESTSNRTQPGLGLGLTLVRELVELHGGTVRAESPGRGGGATFIVRLPIAAALLPNPDSVPPAASSQGIGELEGVRVFVVDDEEDAREAILGVLSRRGAVVSAASNVDEAMDAIRARPPDVIVSDLGMPGHDGYDLVRRLRALPASAGGATPAVVLSGYATPVHRSRAIESGFQAYLEKPVVPEDLVATIVRLVGRST